jgi:hypothetical protein
MHQQRRGYGTPAVATKVASAGIQRALVAGGEVAWIENQADPTIAQDRRT